MRRHSTLIAIAALTLGSGFASAQETPATPPAAETQPATSPPASPSTETPATTAPQGNLAMPERVSTAPVEKPSRGQSMDSVKAKFGSPSQEVSSVGLPPISRWEYPGYVVFFENDKVLHTVVMR